MIYYYVITSFLVGILIGWRIRDLELVKPRVRTHVEMPPDRDVYALICEREGDGTGGDRDLNIVEVQTVCLHLIAIMKQYTPCARRLFFNRPRKYPINKKDK